jgi:hypothetical protein
MAGLDPAIHVFLACTGKDVDARVKPGHDELQDWSPLPQGKREFTVIAAAHRVIFVPAQNISKYSRCSHSDTSA